MHRDTTPRFPASLTRIGAMLALALGSIATPTLANDLSDYPCTASDVEIVGSGIVINEPCSCAPGSRFNAQVQFLVRNNTSTGRYCIALHLVPDGEVTTTSVDVVLKNASGSSTAPGKSGGERYHDTIMTGVIPNFPCNGGVVCFGQAGVVRGKCALGTCTTVSWNTSNGAANCTTADQNPPGGQCRHQQVCVVGYGATLQCIANCSPSCGGSTTLRACVTAPLNRGPFTVRVSGSDGSSATQSTFGDSSGTVCMDFNVTPTQSPTTTYTLTVTDKDSCSRTATTAVNVTPVVASITAPTTTCNGLMLFNASITGQTGCTFTWTIDGLSLATFAAGGSADDARVARGSGSAGQVLRFRALDNVCHTIAVAGSCTTSTPTACRATASTRVKQCASTSGQACTP